MQVLQRTGVPRLFSASRSLALCPWWACASIFLITLLLRCAILPWLPVPKPVVHDEFSYLLAADTYAHGRLANPTHPMWQHFETFQEMQQPTYSAKYQPLQGMVLAFGEKLFNLPWVGVLLSTALACAATCWMLQGWISGEWALLGALLFALRIGVLSYWMNSYEGGSVPAIGGALALGAMGRIWHNREFRHAATWAVGISILMLSRPYDAAVLAVSSAAVLVYLLHDSMGPLFRAAVPAGAVFIATIAAIGYNDYRVTGSALSLPYQVHDRQYAVASMFLMMPLRPEPVYRHAVMREFWTDWNVGQWKESRTDFIPQFFGKGYILIDFFFGFWPIALPLLLAPFALKTTAERLSSLLMGICLAALGLLIGVLPHYAAAFSGVFYLRFLQSLRRVRAWRKPFGPTLAVAVPTLFVLGFVNATAGIVAHRNSPGSDPIADLAGRDTLSTALAVRGAHFGAAREEMDRDLANLPEGQLVLVRYAPAHNMQEEWVYNRADIDSSRVIWAREMGPAADAPLLDYYRGRRAWLAEPDAVPPRLTPYPAQSATVAMKTSATPERQP